MDDILIVDDEVSNLQLLSEILIKDGYRVRPANKPQLAIDSATSQPPKLILLDVKMPEMDGFEACRYLKQNDRTRNIPIIFVSALRDAGARVTGLEAGGVDFISKPFDESEVLARVRTHVNLRNLQLDLERQVRKRTEEVFASESLFRSTFEQAAVGIAHVAPGGQFLRLNDTFCDIVDYSRSELLELSFQDITHPDDLNADLEQVNLLLNGEIKTYSMEKRYVRKTGNLVWANLTVSLVRDDAGRPKWFVAVIQDVSEQKKAEENLHIFKRIIDVSPDSAYLVDSAGRFVYVNEAACNGLGYSRDELLQMELFDVDPATSKEMWPRFWGERRDLDVLNFEATHRRKDGSTFPVEITSVYIEFDGKEFVNGFARDITERQQAEMELRESERQLREAQQLSHVGSWEWEVETDTVHWSDELYEVMGRNPDLPPPCYADNASLYTKDSWDLLQAAVEKALRLTEPYELELDILRPDGTVRHAIVRGEAIQDQAGRVTQLHGTVQDITERKKVEEDRRKSEEKFRRLVENVPDVFWTTDATGKTTYISENVREIFGFSQEEVYDLSGVWVDRIHPDDVDQVMQKYACLFQSGEMFDAEYRIRHKDGHWIWLHDRSMSIYQKDGVSYADGLFSDISQRKRAEEKLSKSEARFRSYFHLPIHGVAITSPNKGWIEVNDRICSMMGYDRDEILRTTWAQLTHPDDLAADIVPFDRALAGEIDTYSLDKRFIRKDGSVIWTHLDVGCVRNALGEIDYFVAVLADITDRKMAELELQQSRDHLEHLINSIPDAVFSVKLPERIIEWARDSYNVLGTDVEELIGETTERLYNTVDEFNAIGELTRKAIRNNTDAFIAEALLRNEKGEEPIPVEINVTIYRENGEPMNAIALVRDISFRKQAQQALENSEARLKEAQRIAQIGNWELDLSTNTLTWSDEVFRIFEIDPERFEANYDAFLNTIHPDDRDMVDKAHIQSWEERRPYKIDYRLLMRDGRVKHVHEQCETVYSPEGKPKRSVATIQDITDRVDAEMESAELRLQLAHLGRTTTLNELASSLAHEISQPLGAILRNAETAELLLGQDPPNLEEAADIAGEIRVEVKRAGEVIGRMRDMIKHREMVFDAVSVSELVNHAVGLLKAEAQGRGSRLDVRVPAGLPPVRGDVVHLQQVLINLILNGLDAMDGRNGDKQLEIQARLADPETVEVAVSDRGAGIPEEVQPRLFDPFFTSKASGLGMGLPIAKRCIESHDGRIWAENNRGGGATFKFTLKVAGAVTE